MDAAATTVARMMAMAIPAYLVFNVYLVMESGVTLEDGIESDSRPVAA
jgi:hypothetical protein